MEDDYLIGDGGIVVKTTRPHSLGVLYDILRPLDIYIEAARKNGLTLENQVGLIPTEDFLKSDPRYIQFASQPLCHLLIFKNSID